MKGIVLFEEDYCLLPVTCRGSTLWTKVDQADAEWARQLNWCCSGSGGRYAMRYEGSKSQYLHRLITKANKKSIVDHINRDTLDNRKSNLRIATKKQNRWNCTVRVGCTSSYTGVVRRSSGHWNARIKNGTNYTDLGTYTDEREAAAAYNLAAKQRCDITLLNDVLPIEPVPAKLKAKPKTDSGLWGVYKNNNRWEARIRVAGITLYLGLFKNKTDAALAYNEVATAWYGLDYYRLNNVS